MKNIDRREFLGAAAVAGAALLAAPRISFAAAEVPLEEATVASLQAAMAAGQTTAKKINERLSRTHCKDRQEYQFDHRT